MTKQPEYAPNLVPKFDFLQVIDVPSIISAVRENLYSQTLCKVNDSVVRIGVIQGELHWHKHDREDEFFFVLEGTLHIDLEKDAISLGPNQGYVIPRGIVHRTRAEERTTVLLVEADTIAPAGDPG